MGLVLRRERNERVFINDNIVIEVTHIGADFVRLHFLAPQSVIIHREEVYLRASEQQATDATTVARAETRGEG